MTTVLDVWRAVDPEARLVSGSMDRENRLGLVMRALGLLLDELAPEDRVGLVVYGSNGRVLLPHTRDLEAIRDLKDSTRVRSSTPDTTKGKPS